MSPAKATINPAPIDGFTSLIVILKPVGRPNNVGSSDKEYCVLATQIGRLEKPCLTNSSSLALAFSVITTS